MHLVVKSCVFELRVHRTMKKLFYTNIFEARGGIVHNTVSTFFGGPLPVGIHILHSLASLSIFFTEARWPGFWHQMPSSSLSYNIFYNNGVAIYSVFLWSFS
jgi:hypothetical protein